MDNRSDRVCVIGAGYVGNGVAGALKRAGVPYDQVEVTDRVGGNWSHGVYDSTHLISSKRSTQYAEFPMPADYPTFPSRAQMLAYLQSYVDHYGLAEHLEFRTEVVEARPVDANGMAGWVVRLASGEERHYRALVVANGHYWERNLPQYPGEFTGRQLHSKDYRRPADFAGERVLVVGAGNSASDIAVEASATFGSSDISMRRGYWFIPKAMFGIPVSELDRVWLPMSLQRTGFKLMLRLSYGTYQRYGLKRPDHKLFTRDVTVNSSLMYALQHGKVRPRPEIERFDGSTVHFADGTSDDYDTVVWATGFRTRFPMLDESMFVWENGDPLLIEHVLAPRYANIYLMGLVAPRSGAGRIISDGAAFLAEAIPVQARFAEPLSDVLARWVPANSSMLAGSAEILTRIKILRQAVRLLAATSVFRPQPRRRPRMSAAPRPSAPLPATVAEASSPRDLTRKESIPS
ncbi:flavin-containing monooxygenase [Gordonia hydrophobica]|uniref:NAD(P)-binding domain-containing protein n=1 Tax=Gordonia hydrophobica TaxID=40516 RepID=A0ABZ2U2Q1_9ACTN|nr:NAD(P)-binding domain-containing protein [Gordonia hydrophobica]MBM7367271.1 NADPH-dependent 2,4-dienoyl-CoA reductase/sulfur reductase-like enzyme [Gordonia hydrophobica]